MKIAAQVAYEVQAKMEGFFGSVFQINNASFFDLPRKDVNLALLEIDSIIGFDLLEQIRRTYGHQ